ncbi:hypothetical protein MW290_32180 (plasmid) [Aquincola tertiaricarbonis]|uniref:Uncharacterized protein n=1 Tax=Aquincola tertiaricarbonis TaxID=391953 RepID=A0ABY4SIM9_AQUTE|nr:hypothetical protein [Aquincola tertiaricarbonis]URI11987.1 hypothetical protein MW290_32180 [Aquincola tertiaricarbonis]
MKSRILNLAAISSVILCGACGVSPEGKRQATAGASSASADEPLFEVYVPGSVRSAYGNQETPLNPLLNPKTPAPAFNEDSVMARQCAPSSLDPAMYEGSAPLVDRVLFERTMQQGRETAQARQLWEFNQARLQAQLKVVSGPRSQRSAEPVQPRPSSSGRTPIFQVPRSLPAPRNPWAKQQEELAHNRAVLDAQNERITALSQQYAKMLTKIYSDALSRFIATPTERITLARLNAFDSFRVQQVLRCIETRGETDAATTAQLQQLHARYQPVATAVVSASRAEVANALNAAASSAALQQAWHTKFSTPWLRDLASNDARLSEVAAARSQLLLAQEAQARAEEQRRAAAQAERQAAQLRKQNLDKGARNVAPTPQEVLELATNYLYQNTASQSGPDALGPLERTSNNSFNDFRNVPLLGRLQAGRTSLDIVELNCRPQGKRQACKVSLRVKAQLMDFLLGLMPSEGKLIDVDAEFQWTANGLQSEELDKALPGIRNVIVTRGGGASSASDKSYERYKDQQEYIQNYQQFVETRRSEAAGAGHWYGGESPQNLRRQYGP